MTKQELELAANLLELASDEFSNHGCNDFRLPDSWTQEECDEFMKSMAKWNGDLENYTPGRRTTMDWYVMAYLSSRLKSAYE